MPQVRLASRDDLFYIVHFNISMALETEDIALNNEEITQGVQAVFDDSHLGRYCVATINNQIVGSLLLTTEWSDWHNKYYWWIQSVYVNPQYRRSGVYKTLYEFVCNSAKEHGDVYAIRLYVDINNKIAQQVYNNLGMHKSNYDMFEEVIKF
ncbi:MAG: GNAT family N-acetyltransferase [SAR202 cluster bacterium]|nr:GNAT family N-acetyltransferase [SAR202 cluster bacterium]